MSVSNRITPASVHSYARAFIAFARVSLRLGQKGYSTMVVPSRGAVPFVQHAQSYRRTILSPFVAPLERVRLLHGHVDPLNVSFNAPFTADMGSTGVPDLSTAQIRRFWVKVIAAIVRGDRDDAHYRLYRFSRDRVCSVGHHDNFEFRIDSGRFIFVDTVISGRAVSEIVEAFEEEGLREIHYVLLVDAHGSRMHPPHRAKIEALKAAGRATLIGVDDMFTEDQGPAVSGVWSVVMPSLMDRAREMVPAFAGGSIGAGLYYWEVMARPDKSNLPVTRALSRQATMFDLALRMAGKADEIAEDLDIYEMNFASELSLEAALMPPAKYQVDMLPDMIQSYLEIVETCKLFDQAGTERIAAPRLKQAAGVPVTVDASSSHCLRLDISSTDAADLIREFNRSLGQPYSG